MEKVFVYKNSSGDYRVHPAVVVLTGGETLRVVNATNVTMTGTLPAGSSDPSDPVTAMTRSSQIAARGNSDPVLIIEN